MCTDDARRIERAHGTGRVPVVLVHGPRPLPSSRGRGAVHVERAGFTSAFRSWPDDPKPATAIHSFGGPPAQVRAGS
ncbi:hypothetical protein [Streptomyces avermitilis]|uniref:hypothetical protein n=1 Tax=Streptomyces avermitilis TaxID=33903 RepID=UPI00382818F6